jgi:hypothetical protein
MLPGKISRTSGGALRETARQGLVEDLLHISSRLSWTSVLRMQSVSGVPGYTDHHMIVKLAVAFIYVFVLDTASF